MGTHLACITLKQQWRRRMQCVNSSCVSFALWQPSLAFNEYVYRMWCGQLTITWWGVGGVEWDLPDNNSLPALQCKKKKKKCCTLCPKEMLDMSVRSGGQILPVGWPIGGIWLMRLNAFTLNVPLTDTWPWASLVGNKQKTGYTGQLPRVNMCNLNREQP